MKLLFPALAVFLFAGCTQTIYTHRSDFSPSKPKGPWTDYYEASKTEQAQPGKTK